MLAHHSFDKRKEVPCSSLAMVQSQLTFLTFVHNSSSACAWCVVDVICDEPESVGNRLLAPYHSVEVNLKRLAEDTYESG